MFSTSDFQSLSRGESRFLEAAKSPLPLVRGWAFCFQPVLIAFPEKGGVRMIIDGLDYGPIGALVGTWVGDKGDRKSTRLNSSH